MKANGESYMAHNWILIRAAKLSSRGGGQDSLERNPDCMCSFIKFDTMCVEPGGEFPLPVKHIISSRESR